MITEINGVGDAFALAGQVYVLGFAIALGMAALIKLINHVVSRSDAKEQAKKDEENAA